jgi:hypothetical protein
MGLHRCWVIPVQSTHHGSDWQALNRRFVIPPNIWFDQGLIRDQDNRVDLFGVDEVEGLNGLEPIDVWEAEERELDRVYGRPDLGEGKAGPVPSN